MQQQPSGGRPRNPDIDRAIIAAALDEVAELGYADASMTGIARRAAVPKSTVYRRWESKQDLVIEAIAHLDPHPEIPSTGDVRVDVFNQMAHLVGQWQDKLASAVMLAIITEVARNPELYRVWNKRFVTPFRERISAVLARGIASGRIRADCDVDLIAELMLALPLHAKMRPDPPDLRDLADRFTDTIFEGLLLGDATAWPVPNQRSRPTVP